MLTRAPSLSSSDTYLIFLKWQQCQHLHSQLFLLFMFGSNVTFRVTIFCCFATLSSFLADSFFQLFFSNDTCGTRCHWETRWQYNYAFCCMFINWIIDWQWPVANNFKRHDVISHWSWCISVIYIMTWAWRALSKVCTSYDYLVNIS